ncbi:glycosyltransferase 87 family protein [Actinoplanes sp. N902-109]|uniref:glycosyltransferase 87 family protein n=1 Tax=Actinoplanes sp. (strain N902-109) TaxID=649831 RepID=UPI0003295BBC|nr:glycosyltransferase 87 family protein [Actinoplanes sp. N902-109]AGL21671.1 hypothetical protein L083_8161 [Actinoplanes sp. N902-109]
MPAMRTSARPATSRSVVVVLACVGILAAITTIAQRYGFSTLALDRSAARSWLDGTGLYTYREPVSHLGTALPPPAALLLAPAAFLPLPVAGWLLALAGVAALALALIALAGPVAWRHGRRPWPLVLAAGALALTLEPIRAVLGLGTLDLLVFGLITADLVALRRSKASAGLGIGLATALSVSSLFFVGYLLVTRQRRAALTALGTSAAAALVIVLVAPRETAAWFSEVLWRIDRSGPVDAIGNQSLAGVLARLYLASSTPVLLWLSFGMLVLAVGMIRARAAHAEGDEVAAFTLVGLTAAIIGPVSGTHELPWVLPAMIVLADVATAQRISGRRRTALAVTAGLTYLLFVLAPMWSLTGAFAVNSYALALILLVNTLPIRDS